MKDNLTLVEQTQKNIVKYISSHPEIKQLPKEQEFVELFGVSRVVLREALSRLRALGIIETKKKKGTEVVHPHVFGVINTIISSGALDKNTLKDLYGLRLMLEVGAADFIFRGKTEQNMAELEEIVVKDLDYEKQMALATDTDERIRLYKEKNETDLQFHSKLIEMTGNNSLIDFQGILRHLFSLYTPTTKSDHKDQTIVSHTGLFNILRLGSPDEFRMAMRLHLNPLFDNCDDFIEKEYNE